MELEPALVQHGLQEGLHFQALGQQSLMLW
jgi:hypothetical protein